MDRPKAISSLVLILFFLIAQIPFSLAEWIAVGTAPEETGSYNVVIEAIFEGVTGSFPLELEVNETEYDSDGLTVEPVYPIEKTPPIELRYEIEKNGSTDFNMVSNTIEVYFVSGDALLKSEEMALVWENDTYWHVTVNVPFEGEYKAVISLIIEKDGELYGGEFITLFESNQISDQVSFESEIETRVLIPSESFDISAEVLFEDSPLTELENIRANIYGTIKTLTWDRRDRVYDASFTAPTLEGAYQVSTYIDDQDILLKEKVYVADIGNAKSSRCPLAYEELLGCTDMKDVRKCVSDWKSDIIKVDEDDLIQCFENVVGGITVGSIICGDDIGDLDGDGELDLDDIEVLQNLILPLTQTQRQEYTECADYDLDEDVDEDDLQCITNVIAKDWFGGLKGGICFDAVYDSPLKGDLDGDNFIDEDDGEIFDDLVDLADAGVGMPEEVLEAVDFNEDGRVNSEDKTCLNYFLGMDLDNPETLLGTGQTIPESCMSLYGLDECQSIKGDLDGSLIIDQVDEILILLAEKKQVVGYNMACADVNTDGRITIEDVECVKSYTEGNTDVYFACIGCDEHLDSAYREIVEICNDGWDNDCDGLIDRTSTESGADLCECGENTPCWMKYDDDGGTSPGVSDGGYQVCRKAEWISGDEDSEAVTGGSTGGGDYQWISPGDLECEEGKGCETLLCAGSAFKCANDGAEWSWYDGELPNETDDPDASPKLCEDEIDNDCDGEDLECEEDEEDDEEEMLWIGLAVGFVVGWLAPGASPLLAAASGLGGSLLCGDDAACAQFLGGAAIGLAIGGLAGKAAAKAKGDLGRKLGAGSLTGEAKAARAKAVLSGGEGGGIETDASGREIADSDWSKTGERAYSDAGFDGTETRFKTADGDIRYVYKGVDTATGDPIEYVEIEYVDGSELLSTEWELTGHKTTYKGTYDGAGNEKDGTLTVSDPHGSDTQITTTEYKRGTTDDPEYSMINDKGNEWVYNRDDGKQWDASTWDSAKSQGKGNSGWKRSWDCSGVSDCLGLAGLKASRATWTGLEEGWGWATGL